MLVLENLKIRAGQIVKRHRLLAMKILEKGSLPTTVNLVMVQRRQIDMTPESVYFDTKEDVSTVASIYETTIGNRIHPPTGQSEMIR